MSGMSDGTRGVIAISTPVSDHGWAAPGFGSMIKGGTGIISEDATSPASLATEVKQVTVPVSTNTTLTTAVMPTVTTVTMTMVNTALTSNGDNCIISATGTLTTTTTSITDHQVTHSNKDKDRKDSKQKSDSEEITTEKVKRRNIHINDEAISGEISPVVMMQKMFSEIIGIKTTVNTMNNSITLLQNKMEMIQEGNQVWKQKLGLLENDITEVKASVEMVHNLILDETQDRQTAVNALKNEIVERSVENQNTLQLVKTQTAQMKTVKELVKGIQGKIDELDNQHSAAVAPITEIKSQVEEMLGQIDYPVKKTIMAQNVWYAADEDIYKTASTIINKALELPAIKIVKVVRKSGQDTGAGLLKIELDCADSVKMVLKNKAKL